MKSFLLFATGALACGVALSIPAAPTMESGSAEPKLSDFSTAVRVLLEREATSAVVSSTKGVLLRRGNDPRWSPVGNSVRLTVAPSQGAARLHVDGIPIVGDYVHLRPETAGHLLELNHDPFRGALRFSLRGGKFSVTNILPLEEYLLGSLAKEMSPSWDLEALKAQAVASRTYALHMIKHPKHALYDLEKSIQDQVYAGVDSEAERAAKAIRQTAGWYLSLPGKREPIKAYFHSRCGGTTETAKTVWKYQNDAYRREIDCPFCRKNRYVWQTSLRYGELARALRIPMGDVPPQIKKVERSPTGRVASLTLQAGGSAKTLTSDEFRNLIGYTRIKSAHFDWKSDEQGLHIEGVGAGHGVGMCQWGARHLAKAGRNYQEILTHYYPQATLYRLAP